MKILSKKEAKEIEKNLVETYDCEIDLTKFVILSTSKENKIWLASREIFDMNLEELKISSIGMYFGRMDKGKLRLSVEGAQIIGKTSKKNICEIKEVWDFLRGFDIKPHKLIKCEENQYVIVKNETDVLGVAKLQNEILKNVLPKSRKITSLVKYED